MYLTYAENTHSLKEMWLHVNLYKPKNVSLVFVLFPGTKPLHFIQSHVD